MPRRSIDTEMWSDDRFDELSAYGKLVFIRLTTGPDITSAGAVRLAPKRVAVDCGISREDVAAAVSELVDAGLVRSFDDGWLWLPNWIKHQVSGPGFIGAARRSAKALPDSLRRAVGREIDRLFPKGRPVDNSPDGPEPGKEHRTDPGQTTDNHTTENVAPSGDDWGLTPQETPQGTGGQTGGPSCFRERGSVPVPVTGPGLTYGQSVLVHGQRSTDDASSSAAAGPPPSREDGNTLAEIVDLNLARGIAEPDPAREAERVCLAQEIEERRRQREEATA